MIEVRKLRHLLYVGIKFLYNRFFWPFLPRVDEYIKFNDVSVLEVQRDWTYISVIVSKRRLFDSVVPWQTPSHHRPSYKDAAIDALRENVRRGDNVVVIGGGISSIVAARQADSPGRVTVYEGGEERVKYLKKILSLNEVENICTVQHAIVGTAYQVYGDEGDPNHVMPCNLPDCDILEMDCEGAELEILKNLTIQPRVIIVETHPNYGSSDSSVQANLERLGYLLERRVDSAGDTVFIARRGDS